MRRALFVAALALWLPASADGYVCTETQPGGPSLAWDEREIAMHLVYEDGQEIASGELEAILLASMAEWNAPSCSDFTLSLGGEAADARATFDWEAGAGQPPNQNIVVLRTDELDNTGVDAWLHPAGALAITTVTFVRSDGRILDADIEINDDGFEFTTCDPEDCVVIHDVANMLTHELGHVVGLDHPPSNQAGAREASMFASAPSGETQKRDLSQDDIDGLCVLYPAGADTAECAGGQRRDPPEITLREVGPLGLPAELVGGCDAAHQASGEVGAGVMLGVVVGPLALWVAGFSRRRTRQR